MRRTDYRAEFVQPPFPLDRVSVALIGEPLAMSSHVISLVGEAVPFVGATLAFDRDEVAPLGEPDQFFGVDRLRRMPGGLATGCGGAPPIRPRDESLGRSVHTHQFRFGPLDGGLRPLQRVQRLGPFDLLVQVSSRQCQPTPVGLACVQGAVVAVSQPFALIGQRFPLICQPLPLVGQPLTLVRTGLPEIRPDSMFMPAAVHHRWWVVSFSARRHPALPRLPHPGFQAAVANPA